jgi:hypothetical protein
MKMSPLTGAILSAALCLNALADVEPPIPQPDFDEINRLIDQIPNSEWHARRFNPRDMVAVVNRLQCLDKPTAMRILQHRNERNRIVVMRFLFDPPEGELHPSLYLPWDEYRTPSNPSFPAIVLEGVPIYLFPFGGGGGSGPMPPVREYFDWYRTNGTLIQEPLSPCDAPLAVWQAWLASPLRQSIAKASARELTTADQLVQKQLLRMVETIHPREFDEDTLIREDVSQLWASAVETLETTATRWNDTLTMYVRAADGSYIEPVPEPQYKQISWQLPIERRTVHLRMHRLSERFVRVLLEQDCRDAPRIQTIKVSIFDVDDPHAKITFLILSGSFVDGTASSMRGVSLPTGVSLRATAYVNNEVIGESHIMSPDELDPDPPRSIDLGFD